MLLFSIEILDYLYLNNNTAQLVHLTLSVTHGSAGSAENPLPHNRVTEAVVTCMQSSGHRAAAAGCVHIAPSLTLQCMQYRVMHGPTAMTFNGQCLIMTGWRHVNIICGGWLVVFQNAPDRPRTVDERVPIPVDSHQLTISMWPFGPFTHRRQRPFCLPCTRNQTHVQQVARYSLERSHLQGLHVKVGSKSWYSRPTCANSQG
jgi:hypothetical protein